MEELNRAQVVERFEEAKQMEKNILEANRRLCTRVDYVLDLYSSYVELYGETAREFVSPKDFIQDAEMIQLLLDDVEAIIDAVTFDDISREEDYDPFKYLIDEVAFLEGDKDSYDMVSMWMMLTKFRMIRPYGEHFQQIRQLVRNELHAIEAAEELRLNMEEAAEDGADED